MVESKYLHVSQEEFQRWPSSAQMDYEKFDFAIDFILDRERLSEKVSRYMVALGGGEAQGIIYNVLGEVVDIHNQNSVIDIAAEMYFYQQELNRKLNRCIVDPSSRDGYLLECVIREINSRHHERDHSLPEYDPMDTDLQDEIFLRFQVKFGPKASGRITTVADMLDEIRLYQKEHPHGSIEELLEILEQKAVLYPAREQSDDHHSYSELMKLLLKGQYGTRLNKAIQNKSNLCKALYHRDWLSPPKDRDDLYLICIALGISDQTVFEALRQAAACEQRDPYFGMTGNRNADRENLLQRAVKNLENYYAKFCGNVPEIQPELVLRDIDRELEEAGLPTLLQSKRKIHKKKRQQ